MVTSISVVIVVNRRFDCQILVQTTPSVWENVVDTFKIMVNQSTLQTCQILPIQIG